MKCIVKNKQKEGAYTCRVFAFTTLCLISSWLAANPITDENLNAGSRGWVLSGASSGHAATDAGGQIKGYMSATSVNKGGQIDFKVSVKPAQNFTIEIYRIGWYGGKGGRAMQTIGPLAGITQPACPRDEATGMVECDWSTSYRLTVPAAWTSGIYVAKLKNESGFDSGTIFVIRDDNRSADVLYKQPVNTYQAYSQYPEGVNGKSLYEPSKLGEGRAYKVSFNRPYPGYYSGNNGYQDLVLWELLLVEWLEKEGYDVAYTTDVDVHANGANLLKYRAFISPGHDEYWSKEMRDAADNARASKVNLAFFGANASYWQVRYEPGKDGKPNRTLVCYKEDSASLDPQTVPALKTDLFRSALVKRPEQGLMGVQFVASNSAFSKSSYYTDLVVKNISNWVYRGTGLIEGQHIPQVVGYEIDNIHPGVSLPPNKEFTILAESPFIDVYGKQYFQNSVVYKTLYDGWVFAAGTMAWQWGLTYDPDGAYFGDLRSTAMQAMTKNIMDRFSGYNHSPTGKPVISGMAKVAQTLSVNTSGINDADGLGAFKYQWLRNGSPISGATSSSYRLTEADGGNQISVAVSYTDGWDKPETVISSSVTILNSSLPDLVVTALSYSGGVFTSTIKNQGTAETTDDVAFRVGYLVDGVYKTYGIISNHIHPGQIMTAGTTVPYVISSGTHTITAWVDDDDQFVESDENNNQLSQTIQVGGSDNAPPSVTITAPTSGSTVSGGTVTVNASATDNVGVVGVQFKLDGVSLGGEDAATPYSITWDTRNFGNGTHTLTATARDAAGNIASSSPITVTINNPTTTLPDVIVTNLTYSNGVFTSTVKNQGTKATPSGVVIGVSYLVDGVEKTWGINAAGNLAPGASVTIGTDASPYHIPNGTHTISALADDMQRFPELDETNNELAKTVTINVTDSTLPTVAITSPSNGAVLPRSILTITATASDNIGVSNVQFKLDGVNLGSKDYVAPYALSFNTTSVANGSHTLTAVAQDAAGNSATSNSVMITVNNDTVGSLPDVVVTAFSYSNGVFSCTVKNQGTVATPDGIPIGVSYYVNGSYKNYGVSYNSLAAGASVNIGTAGKGYVIPSGTQTIAAEADDNNRFAELSETNNLLSKTINVP